MMIFASSDSKDENPEMQLIYKEVEKMQFSGSTVCHETLTVKWTDFGYIDTDISIPHSLLSYLPRMDHMQLLEVLKTEDS